jgi:TonB-dependent Receptor Plug Domain
MIMKRLTVRSCALPVTTALCLAALRLSAQTAAPAEGQTQTKEETTEAPMVLSPFVVEATEDSGYQANSTLAGTRVRTDLKDVASSISVVTQQFLQDTGVKNSQGLLVYTTNTEVAGLHGNYSGQGGQSVYQENTLNPNNTTRVRGLDSADNTRDYFLTDIPWDGFNVGRVDLQRGPNSILFGVGSPAGIINTSLNMAAFKNSYMVQNVTSSYGSQRNLGDFNYVVLKDELALRFAVVNDQEQYRQKPAFNDTTRYYGALRFDPKLFNGGDSHTSLRANYENGSVSSNNPRTQPPEDEITPFFQTGSDQYGNPYLNKLVVDQYIPGQSSNSALVNSTYNKGGFAQGRTYWPTVLSYFNGSAGTSPGVPPAVTNNIPTTVISGTINSGWRIDSTGAIGGPYNPGNTVVIGGLPNFRPIAVPNYQQYAANTNIPGGSYYADQVLTDPSIYDFYGQLLDGDNKHEWQNWNAWNVALSQTFFNDRLGLELAYDQQSYTAGQVGFLQGVNYAINIDPNVVLSNGATNPNLGRPYVANSAAAGNSQDVIDRDSTRLTLFGEVRTEDYFGKGTLSEILGHHRFTVVQSLDHKTDVNTRWSEYGTDLGWESLNNLQLNTNVSNYRQFDWVDYLGGSLLGASTASGAHLSNITNIIAPATGTAVTYFNSHWNKPTSPGSPGYVDPSASAVPSATPVAGWINVGGQYYNPGGYYAPGHSPNDALANPGTLIYSYLNSNTATPVSDFQSNNPANYVGWQQAPVTWLSAKNASQFPDLVTGGQRTEFRDQSTAFTWQGFLFGDTLAATFGWRKDRITNYATSAPVDLNTGVTALNYATDQSSRRQTEGQSRTWGGVLHTPKFINSHLPWGTSFDLIYDKSENFKADAPRTDLAGQTIANPAGTTKEYGLAMHTLEDKLTVKWMHYETKVERATLNITNGNSIAGLGGNGYWLWAAPSWGYGFAANLQYGMDGHFGIAGGPQGNNWNYAYQDLQSAGATQAQLAAVADPNSAGFKATPQYAQEQAIVNAWLTLPVSDTFFNYFGINPTIDPSKAHASGKLYDAFVNFAAGGSVGSQQPGAISSVSTSDNISKGDEIELTAQLTKNWDISVNYAKTNATKTNIDPATVKFMQDNLAFFSGPGGSLRLWGVGGTPIGPQWIQNIYDAYQVSALAAGQSTPEVAPWRFNLVTTYHFDHGRIKGLFVGGGMRLQAGKILGYKYDPTILTLNPNEPLKGPNDEHYDLWVGYTRKLTHNLNWRIQANFTNVGDSTKLVPGRYQPDGTLALANIQDGMTWQLTNSFEF